MKGPQAVVQRRPGGRSVYEVGGGLIQSVWFFNAD